MKIKEFLTRIKILKANDDNHEQLVDDADFMIQIGSSLYHIENVRFEHEIDEAGYETSLVVITCSD